MDINNNKKNLILGTAMSYNLEDVNIFINSFREYNMNDDIVLLTDESTYNNVEKFSENNNVKLILIKDKDIDINPNNIRYGLYYKFLKENQYNKIILSDVKDVVFQKNPFEELYDDKFLYFFEEDSSESIGNNTYSDMWIKSSLGNQVLEKIKGKPIICSGITIGSYANILIYLTKMINIFNVIKTQKPEAYNIIGLDQGIHIYIGYLENKNFINFQTKKNGDIIATIGITLHNNPNDIIVKDGVICLKDSHPPIVHQYNRNPELEKLFKNKYKVLI